MALKDLSRLAFSLKFLVGVCVRGTEMCDAASNFAACGLTSFVLILAGHCSDFSPVPNLLEMTYSMYIATIK